MSEGDAPSTSSAPRVLLLHGVMSSKATWWQVAPALERRGWSPLCLDLPWHGDAPRPPGEADLDAFADSVAARLGGPVDAVVGHSLGALVALALVSRHDVGAKRLVLEDPPAVHRADQLRLAAAIRADARAAATDRGALWRRERDANPRWLDPDVDHSVEGVERADGELLAEAIARSLEWDLLALVHAAGSAVHVLASRDVRPSFSDDGGSALHEPVRGRLRALVGTQRFEVLDGGHCLHRDDPAGWLEAVTRALAS